MAKVIFHIDMNAFFASVEEIRYPFLINKPFVIASRGNDKSIISTCSYKAREYGIRSAMPLNKAKKLCPTLMVVEGDYKLYVEYSKKIMNIFLEYTSLVLQASIDEAYLDVTDVTTNYIALATELQTRILTELKLPCSVGIGPTLFLAKMASDMKKPLGITVLRKKDIKKKIYPLSINEFFGIGKKTAAELAKLGVETIGDLEYKKDICLTYFKKKSKEYIYSCLYGQSSDVVDPKKYDEISSISNSRTYINAVETLEEANTKLNEVAHILYPRIKKYNLLPKTITIQIRYEGFITKSKSKTLKEPIIDFLDLISNAMDVFEDLWNQNKIKLLGIGVSNFVVEEYNLFTINSKENKINEVIDELNKKIGKKVVNKSK